MANMETVRRLEKASLDTKLWLLDLCNQKTIHIGGDMSCCDFMTVIWQYAMRYDTKNPRWEDRDRFVLSKGHAAAVTSFSQAAIGCYDAQDIFKEYATDNGRFGMHSCNLKNPYVDVSTGSLGHGLPIAGGLAAALRKKGSSSRVYVVIGDGECHEGSIWEAAMAVAGYKLGNLILFADRNRMSLDGPTEDLMPLEPYAEKWKNFGWNVIETDGHNIDSLVDIVDKLPAADSKKPTAVICNTVKGKWLSFIENDAVWHAGMISDEMAETGKRELREAFTKKWGKM